MQKKEDNGIKYIFTKGLILIVTGLMFGLMSLPVLAIKSDFWAVVFSLVIIVPYFYVIFISGRMSGEYCYKMIRKNQLKVQQGQAVAKGQKLLEYHWAKGLLFSVLFPAWQIILLILGLIIKNGILCGIVAIYNMGFMGILSVFGLYKAGADILDLLFLIIILLLTAAFEAGYITGGEKLKKQHQEIESEIRFFNSL